MVQLPDPIRRPTDGSTAELLPDMEKCCRDQIHEQDSETSKEGSEGTTTHGTGKPLRSHSEGRWKRWTRRKVPAVVPVEDERRRLSWPKLTICLIVEAIALGTLGMPQAFASMGMGAGIGVSLFLGGIATYTAMVIGAVKVKFPGVQHYADAVGLIFGRLGYEIAGIMFIALLGLLLGSHTLTGTIAFNRIVDNPDVCSVGYGAASTISLFLLALPPSFAEFAILGYVDFCSIVIAVGVVTVASGIHAFNRPGGVDSVEWSWLPPADATFQSAFLGSTNIIFAYTFAVAMFSFMSEMRDVRDHPKAVYTLGVIQTTIYTATGAMIYAWIGQDVESPALLSATPRVVSKVALGLALPVIFISGSINSNVVGAYIIDRYWPSVRKMPAKKFWLCWSALLGGITVLSWIIASVIPFFNALLGLISSLFTSGFTFYFPALFWFMLLKEGKWNASWKNVGLSALNLLVLAIGLLLLVCGTYVSIWQTMEEYAQGETKGPFSCVTMEYKKEMGAPGQNV